MVKLINTDEEKCVKCGRCAFVCPVRVLDLDPEGYPVPNTDAFRLCINCGYCVDICPYDALNHRVRKRSHSTRAAVKRYHALLKEKGEKTP